MDKLCYIHTMEYYSVLKVDESLSQDETGRNLGCTLPSEGSQLVKAANYVIPTI